MFSCVAPTEVKQDLLAEVVVLCFGMQHTHFCLLIACLEAQVLCCNEVACEAGQEDVHL